MGLFRKLFSFTGAKVPPRRLSDRVDAIRREREAAEQARSREGFNRAGERLVEEAKRLGEEARRQIDQENREKARKDQEDREREAEERDPLWRYLYLGEWVQSPESSNVAAFRYLHETRNIEIEFHDGSLYQYMDCDIEMAKSFFRSSSRGKWVWSNLRVRGTQLGARVEYVLLSGPSRAKRKWERTQKTGARHAKKVAKQSGLSNAYQKLGAMKRKKPKET